jgi:hypothetical protein
VSEVFSAARLAVRMRRIGSDHLERLRAGLGPETPLLLLPFLFGRSHGPRAIHQVAELLAEELPT